MNETKFKVGDKVFSIFKGVVVLTEGRAQYPVTDGDADFYADGRLEACDSYPCLYTLDEARRMGFPVPAEPVVFEATVRFADNQSFWGWHFADKGPVHELAPLQGKRVRVTVEVIEGGQVPADTSTRTPKESE